MTNGRRDAISAALGTSATFTSAQALYAGLRANGQRVGLATVYRHLQALAEAGEVDVLRTDDGETVYRRCATDRHHHHLVCRVCGATVEVADRAVERWAERVAAEHGFRDAAHTVEIYGTCRSCAGG
ncbi:MAG: transcriptional repressor [Frankiaceae bacterium]|jgi:Fur family ferric uptake transcriptional regulator